MKPLISVIVPVYKVELYLSRCIDSIINQSYKNLEIILVDDGSPDNCGRICDEYANKDNRIKVIHKGNGGLSSARNSGLNVSTGDYIGFVDSDDWIESAMFKSLVELAERENADIVQCGFQEVFNDGTVKRKYCFDNGCYNNNVDILTAYFSQTKIHVVVWNKLYRSYLFDSVSMVEGRLNEDTMVSFELMLKTKKFLSISSVYYNYLQRDTSIIGSSFSPKRLDAIFAGNYVLDLCTKNCPENINYAHILICMYCFYLYNDLNISKVDNELEYEKIILNEFYEHYNKIKNSREFKLTRINNKFLIRSLIFNKYFAVLIYRLYRKFK
ncbi:glycosyltransferase [Clostridium tagluense]|uniref:glycosyltransferase n=1 Tax=Clostridium tagluense TaxID=360422 RepID=UPI001C0E0A17|nr:glycosyltransferase [Clostridium tagluense]MBU3127159.1 glycosyltransferase [Clostridium tagluense]